MKNLKFKIIVWASILLAISCSVPQAMEKDTDDVDLRSGTVIEMQQAHSLLEVLQRLPGVFVDQSRGYSTVTVRGGVPLFVVDGVRVGRGYPSVAGLVTGPEILSVELLTSPSETVMYGREGGNGVILIRTH